MKLSFYTCVAVAALPSCGGAAFVYDPTPGDDAAPLMGAETSDGRDAGIDAQTFPGDAGAPEASEQEAAAPSEASEPTEACTSVTHYNGLGGTWADCISAGTYTAAEALEACLVFQGAHPELQQATAAHGSLYPCEPYTAATSCSPAYVATWMTDVDAGNQQIVWAWIYQTTPGTLGAFPGDVIQYSDTWQGPCILPPSAGKWQ